MNNREFKKLISKLLEPYGFKREKNLWYRHMDGVFAVLRIEDRTYCHAWYVGCGAEFAHTEYERCPWNTNLDFTDLFIFPASQPLSDEWRQYQHTIPRRAPVEEYIQLAMFSDDQIKEYLIFNIERSLVPMLTKESLLKTVHNDPYYLYIGKEKNMHLYGFTADEIQEKNIHVR